MSQNTILVSKKVIYQRIKTSLLPYNFIHFLIQNHRGFLQSERNKSVYWNERERRMIKYIIQTNTSHFPCKNNCLICNLQCHNSLSVVGFSNIPSHIRPLHCLKGIFDKRELPGDRLNFLRTESFGEVQRSVLIAFYLENIYFWSDLFHW